MNTDDTYVPRGINCMQVNLTKCTADKRLVNRQFFVLAALAPILAQLYVNESSIVTLSFGLSEIVM